MIDGQGREPGAAAAFICLRFPRVKVAEASSAAYKQASSIAHVRADRPAKPDPTVAFRACTLANRIGASTCSMGPKRFDLQD